MGNKPIIATQKLWLDKDRNIVPDGDDTAATLLVTPGQTVNPKVIPTIGNFSDYFDEDGDPVESPKTTHRRAPRGRTREED